jgi:hypothetical protein
MVKKRFELSGVQKLNKKFFAGKKLLRCSKNIALFQTLIKVLGNRNSLSKRYPQNKRVIHMGGFEPFKAL